MPNLSSLTGIVKQVIEKGLHKADSHAPASGKSKASDTPDGLSGMGGSKMASPPRSSNPFKKMDKGMDQAHAMAEQVFNEMRGKSSEGSHALSHNPAASHGAAASYMNNTFTPPDHLSGGERGLLHNIASGAMGGGMAGLANGVLNHAAGHFNEASHPGLLNQMFHNAVGAGEATVGNHLMHGANQHMMPHGHQPMMQQPMGMPYEHQPMMQQPMGMPYGHQPMMQQPMGMSPGHQPMMHQPMGAPPAYSPMVAPPAYSPMGAPPAYSPMGHGGPGGPVGSPISQAMGLAQSQQAWGQQNEATMTRNLNAAQTMAMEQEYQTAQVKMIADMASAIAKKIGESGKKVADQA
jgi:hypothetical protein